MYVYNLSHCEPEFIQLWFILLEYPLKRQEYQQPTNQPNQPTQPSTVLIVWYM